jgi:hypothetical protein
MNLDDLFKVTPQTTIETSIGLLSIFSIGVGRESKLLKSLVSSIKKTEPKEYIKKLIAYVCFPQVDLKDGKFKPDKPILSLIDIDRLSNQELEEIAKKYVLSNEYLYKDDEFRTEADINGQDLRCISYENIEYPKKDEESFIEYLHRLLCLEQDRQKERMSTIQLSVSDIYRELETLRISNQEYKRKIEELNAELEEVKSSNANK